MELLQIGFILLSVGLCGYLSYLVYYGNNKLNISKTLVAAVTAYFSFITIFWLVLVAVLAELGFYNSFSTFPGLMGISIIAPMIAMLMLMFFLPSFSPWLVKVPQIYLILGQSFRIFVELLIWGLYKYGLMPAFLTFEGSNFDLFFALTAFPVAFYFAHKKLNHIVLLFWNVLGLCSLFFVIIQMAFSFPTPQQIFFNQPNPVIIAQWPYIWLPTIMVIIAFYLHIYSLRQSYLLLVYKPSLKKV